MGTLFGTMVVLSIMGGPLGLTHEVQLCAMAEKYHRIQLDIPCDPMRLTPAMSGFVSHHVNRDLSAKFRLRQLVWAVRQPGGLGFRYTPDETRTASGAFESRSGDCVSFALMFVALARHAGLDARFQMVNCKTTARESRGLKVAPRHMNVVVFLSREKCEIDITKPIASTKRSRMSERRKVKTLVPDRCALSVFFNNCTVEKLGKGEFLLADRLSRAAVNLAPECADAWVNFGVCQRVLGNFDRAEAAYLRAMGCQRKCRVAETNLQLLRRMKHLGMEEQSAGIFGVECNAMGIPKTPMQQIARDMVSSTELK